MVNENINKNNRRKYVKYERKHSNSLWHTGWTKYNDDEKLIIIEDDASRFIVGFGAYNVETIDNAIETLEHAVELYGKPEELITGTQFFSGSKNRIPGDHDKFQKYLDDNNIKHIPGRIDRPETNSKLKRLNYTVKSLMPYFSTWEEVVYHYNYERMHYSLSSGDDVVTPAMAYKAKMVVK